MPAEKPDTLRDRTYDRLRSMITSGELRPGAVLDERTLIESLGVSRTPFREAISLLQSDGLVEVKPYRGVSVRRFGRKDINDLYLLRRSLEAFAIRQAVDNISNADIGRLEVVLNSAVAALERDDIAAYGIHDTEFHAAIAALSGSQPLVEVLEGLGLKIQMCRTMANQNAGFAKEAAGERDQILDALRRRDADGAANLLDAHIAHAQAIVLQSLADEHDVAPEELAPRTRRTKAEA